MTDTDTERTIFAEALCPKEVLEILSRDYLEEGGAAAVWLVILSALLAAFIAGLLYISFRAAHFGFVRRIAAGRKSVSRLICFAGFVLLTVLLSLIWNLINAFVCMAHLMIFWMICDGISYVISKIRHKEPARSAAGAAAMILCVLYLAGGWYAAHHVWTAVYRFDTGKLNGDFRIVQLTDSHLGTVFHADRFEKYMDEINALSPDAVVLTGDFVDESTTRTDMLGGCDALGRLKTRCGVFFVYGNHDTGYISSERRGWTDAELRKRLEENGVTVLEDSGILIDGQLYLAGRKDRSSYQRGDERKSAKELVSELDRNKYIVLLDHQPFDFDAEAEAGTDLVLCGHTHGGQLIPINHVGEWIGENCLSYGHEKRGDTDFIVSSGIGSWSLQFKTGCRSEIVVVDIRGGGNR